MPDLVFSLVLKLARFFREHPAILASLAYFFVSALGLLYDWMLLKEFGFNVFLFAEANDFLLAGLKDPLTLTVMLGCAVLSVVYYYAGTIASGRYTKFAVLSALVLALFSLLAPAFVPMVRKQEIERGDGNWVTVLSTTRAPRQLEEILEEPMQLISTTESFLFLFDRTTGKSYAVAKTQVAALRREPGGNSWISIPESWPRKPVTKDGGKDSSVDETHPPDNQEPAIDSAEPPGAEPPGTVPGTSTDAELPRAHTAQIGFR